MSEKVAYLVHDLTDAAVGRRIRMLEIGGAKVSVAGFTRGSASTATLPVPTLDLGQTKDARLVSRATSVAKALGQITLLKETVSGADIVIARNLEMLAIASRARAIFAPNASLIYECLDIHRLLLSRGVAGKFLRAIEGILWRDVDALLTSSPAFVQRYFALRRFPGAIELVENKVLEEKISWDAERPPAEFLRSSPPWKIGYFGMLRCAKSFRILKELAERAEGRVEVILRGKFSPAIFPNIQAELKDSSPYIRFLGPYNGETDIRRIYSEVHFSWAIDFYEESLNSSWLLPNRLYESSYAGAVPIALGSVETGRWLEKHNAGVLVSEPLEDDLHRFFSELDGITYDEHSARIRQIPRCALTFGPEDCSRLVALLRTKRSGKAQKKAPLSAGQEAR